MERFSYQLYCRFDAISAYCNTATWLFGAAYRKTYTEMLYGNDVNYGELPLNFDRYSEADQQRILCRMLAVLKAAQAGVDLEKAAPLAVELLPLDEAREQFEAISQAADPLQDE